MRQLDMLAEALGTSPSGSAGAPIDAPGAATRMWQALSVGVRARATRLQAAMAGRYSMTRRGASGPRHSALGLRLQSPARFRAQSARVEAQPLAADDLRGTSIGSPNSDSHVGDLRTAEDSHASAPLDTEGAASPRARKKRRQRTSRKERAAARAAALAALPTDEWQPAAFLDAQAHVGVGGALVGVVLVAEALQHWRTSSGGSGQQQLPGEVHARREASARVVAAARSAGAEAVVAAVPPEGCEGGVWGCLQELAAVKAAYALPVEGTAVVPVAAGVLHATNGILVALHDAVRQALEPDSSRVERGFVVASAHEQDAMPSKL